MTSKRAHNGGVLSRLRRDRRGNTLAMGAIALIPISAMIGSGVDMSRTYLVKARLQSACDAGALATRRTMGGAGTITPEAEAAGQNFFRNNIPNGTYGVTGMSYVQGLDQAGQVVGTARTRVPMSVMRMFQFDGIDLQVGCTARLDITNTDVMFVLDTTGSMAQCPDGTYCGGASKIVGLRQAVMDFTNTLTNAAPSSARIRYGFVPYTSTVNVGDLLPTSWKPASYSYQSRVANFNMAVVSNWQNASGPYNQGYEYANNLTKTDCASWGSDYGSYPVVFAMNGNTASARSYYNSGGDWGYDGSSGDNRACRRNRTDRNYNNATLRYRFSGWTYQPVAYNLSTYISGQQVRVASYDPPNSFTVASSSSYDPVNLAALAGYNGPTDVTQQDGCIEERDTVAQANLSYGSLPANAWDLDVDTVPDGNLAKQWRPAWPQLVWDPGGFRVWDYRGNGYYSCPTAARKLAVMTSNDVQTYVNSLNPAGGTYHDTGMTWGARLISPTGIFASDNASAPNNQPISRNIVFMTDGMMDTNEYIDGLWGYEVLDKRVTGGDFGSSNDRHNARFLAMCSAARAKNVRIWVVSFGTALTAPLQACADPGQAFQANDTATLRQQFATIATRIAKLRLSQ